MNEIEEAKFEDVSEEKALEMVHSLTPEMVRQKVGNRLLKIALGAYEFLLTDDDSKIRRETAKDVFEILGTKTQKRDGGGGNVNIALFPPEYMAKVAKGLQQITKAEVVQIVE